MRGTLVRFAETNPDDTHKEVLYPDTKNAVDVSDGGVLLVRRGDGYEVERAFSPQAWVEVVYDYELEVADE